MPVTTPASASGLSRIWQTRDLLWQFTQRSIELRHKGSHLGLAWSFVQPLLMLGLYVTVFGYIFGGSFNVLPEETPVDFALGIFLGLTLFHFVAEGFAIAPGLIVGNPNFVKKIVFPLVILPASAVGTALFHMVISLGLVIFGVLFYGQGFAATALWLPLILLPVALFALGLTMAISALGVFWRDLAQLSQFLTLLMMYSSGIFFPASAIPPAIWTFLKFNPLLLAIELARDSLLWHRDPNLVHLGYVWITSLLVLALGYWIFQKLRPAFADVL
ncbi:MAG: ABC transporter permease [Synoicihabitans sp.]